MLISLKNNRTISNRIGIYLSTVCLLALLAISTKAVATEWSPVLVLDNGDEILWKLNQVVEPSKRFLVYELRDLSKNHDGIKSFVTQFEIDCGRLRIKEISYDYYAQPKAMELIKSVSIKPNKQRWAYAEWNEYVKFMTGYFCESREDKYENF